MKTSFVNKNDPTGKLFAVELKKRVAKYVASSKTGPYGGIRLHTKAIILSLAFISAYYFLVFESLSLWISVPLSIVFGAIIAGIGFNVMHDGGHGSFSKYAWVNYLTAFSLNILGGIKYLWNLKHNIKHHSFTNIEHEDEDFDIYPFIRTTKTQKRLRFHKYQHIYSTVFYFLTYILWIYMTDFVKYFSGKDRSGKPVRAMELKEHIIFWASKATYFTIFIVIPLTQMSFGRWLIGSVIVLFVCGFILSIVFQMAHVMPNTKFPLPDPKSGEIESEWMLHQLATTTDFAAENKLLSWLVGGLNYQVEHHLFYKISHVHYPKIRLIVKATCEEYGIPYLEYPTFTQAVKAHFSFLKKMGTED